MNVTKRVVLKPLDQEKLLCNCYVYDLLADYTIALRITVLFILLYMCCMYTCIAIKVEVYVGTTSISSETCNVLAYKHVLQSKS